MKCKVCGKHFRLKNSKRYTIPVTCSILDSLVSGNTRESREAFDCPKCGCQNIVNTREYPYTIAEKSEEETEGEA